MGKGKKTVAVFGPDNVYLSHCTWDRAMNLLQSNRAKKLSATSIKLKETKAQIAERRQKIIEDAGRICYICGIYIPEDETATIDHMIPKAKDRIHAEMEENMKCCCYRCNNDKGSMSLVDYVMHISDHRQEYDYISDQRFNELKKYAFRAQKEFQEKAKTFKPDGNLKKTKSWKYKGRRR